MNEETTTAVQVAQPQRIVVQDDSQFSAMLDTGRFEQLWRIAGIFADSQLVPTHYQKNKSNCFLGLQMAFRLGVDPMMLLQNTYMIGGRPGMESKMIIALINSSGLFEDPLDYEIEGSDPKDQKYRVRAVATRKGTGKVCQGPWIDWGMVKAEGWDGKSGSKWKTIPGQMFYYRAAAFFGRLFCPERLLGMQTKEELEDITAPTQAKTIRPRSTDIAARFAKADPAEFPMTAEELAEVTPDSGQQPPEDTAELLQTVYRAITDLAADCGETPDDMLDTLTNGRHGALIDLEDKPTQYLNDILMVAQAKAKPE